MPAIYVLSLDEFPETIELPHPPAYQVDSVEYINPAGQLSVLDPSQYQVDLASEPARIRPVNGWPQIKSDSYGTVKITYRAGYLKEGTPNQNNAPDTIKQSILLMIKHWYDNPEAVVVGVGASTSVNEVPLSATHLLELNSMRYFV